VRLLDVERAREVLASSGYGMTVAGGRDIGGRIAGQIPEPGTPARRGSVVELRLAAAVSGEEITVPDLRGLGLREALARLSGSAIEVARVQGNGMVVRQTPEPGTTVRKGTKCSLVLSPRGV
jgi:beta-lactam-binding protein with PASTA domain